MSNLWNRAFDIPAVVTGFSGVDMCLGRGYYEHGAGERGYRNGYRRAWARSAEGEIEFAVPQVSDTAQPFRSQQSQDLIGAAQPILR